MIRHSTCMEIVREGISIEIEVTGDLNSSEPDVGIMSCYFTDVCAARVDDNQVVELTEEEEIKANELLSSSADDYYDDDDEHG